jgi:branched-subunit amino acid transport protein
MLDTHQAEAIGGYTDRRAFTMSTILVIGSMAALMYALRWSGLAGARLRLPAFWLQVVQLVPLTVFAALFGSALSAPRGDWTIRLVAAVCAGLAVWRVRQLWVGMLVGMSALWLLRYLGGTP